MEQRVGSLIKHSEMGLDLGAMEDDVSSWVGLLGTCKKARPPPITAEQFNELMDEKAEDGTPKIEFTVEDDRKLIKHLPLGDHIRGRRRQREIDHGAGSTGTVS